MAYQRNKGNRGYQKPDRSFNPNRVDINPPQAPGLPIKPERADETTQTFVAKTMKGLMIGGYITPKAEPSTTAATYATPYPLAARPNVIIDANYGSDKNLAGNVLTQLLNDENSKLLNTFDAAILRVQLNYRYIGQNNYVKNSAYNKEVAKTFEESISKGYAETFTNLPIFDFDVYSSDIPEIEGQLAMLISYQTYLQDVALLVGTYNRILAMERHLKTMCYNREEPILNQLFGLLKKATLKSYFTAIGSTVKGEYLDIEWIPIVNKLLMIPARRSSAMTSPLLNVIGSHVMPTVKARITEEGADVFNSATWKHEEIDTLIRRMNPYNILRWARMYGNGDSTVTPNEYFNEIKDLLDTILLGVTKFKNEVTELRTLLDVFSRVNLNKWVKGTDITIKVADQYEPVFNKMVSDLYTSYMAGDPVVKWDNNTMRWRINSLWDKFYGIPSFEQHSGGAALVFGTKDIPDDSSYTASKYLLPILFRQDTIGDGYAVVALNRVGKEISFTTLTLTNAELESDPVLARLNALANPELTLRIPRATAHSSAGYTAAQQSAGIQFIEEVFGVGALYTATSTRYITVSQDKMCLIDVELDDVSNNMISYAKRNSPLRVQGDK